MSMLNKKIKSVEILNSSSDTRKSASSSLVRGAVGGALLGPAGLLAGGLSGKNKTKHMTTFLIKYDDGTQETQTVKNNGIMFNMYMQIANTQENSVKNQDDKYDKLVELKELLDSNIITQDEFEKEKQELLK